MRRRISIELVVGNETLANNHSVVADAMSRVAGEILSGAVAGSVTDPNWDISGRFKVAVHVEPVG